LVLCGAWRYVHRPFNQLFLRDIGLTFVFIGDAFLVGATRPQLRASQIWLLGHALFHFSEAAVGMLALCPFARLPAITVPAIIEAAIIEAVITLWAICHLSAGRTASARDKARMSAIQPTSAGAPLSWAAENS
jgi:hypothetical protein